MSRRLFTILIYLIVLTSSLKAINIHRISTEEGLSQLSVLSIAQDSLGRMWFGTEEGLNLYDGYNMRVFQPGSYLCQSPYKSDESSIGNLISSIISDGQSNMYFISDGRLYSYHIVNESLHNFKMIASAVATHSEKVWVAQNNKLSYFEDNELVSFCSLSSNLRINQMAFANENIYLSTNFGVYEVDFNGHVSVLIPHVSAQTVYCDTFGSVWVGTSNQGVYCYSAIDKTTKHWTVDASKLPSNTIRCFVEDSAKNLWIGTFNGLAIFDLVKSEFVVNPLDTQTERLTHQSVYSLNLDTQGNIWVGTYYGGVNFFHPQKNNYVYYAASTMVRNEKFLSYPFVGDMVEDSNGNLWLCTEGGGLNKLDKKNKKFNFISLGWKEDKSFLKHDNLKAIVYDKVSNSLFIGTHTGGLVRHNLTTKQSKYYYIDCKDYARELGQQVDHLSIYKRTLILQIKGGIYTLNIEDDSSCFKPLFNDNRYRNYWIKTFFVDSKGYIWIAGFDTLSRINLEDSKDRKVFSKKDYYYGRFSITSIQEDDFENVFIGTRGSGVFRYDVAADSFFQYSVDNGQLLSNYCYDLCSAPTGNMVMLSDKGLTFINTKNNELKSIALNKNLPTASFNLGSKVFYSRSENRIYVGSTNGLLSFGEEILANSYQKNYLQFSNLYIDDIRVCPSDSNDVLNKTLALSQEINLYPNHTNFVVDFASTNYKKSNQGITYEYKIENVDKNWITAIDNRIRYNGLNFGSYSLVVREKGVQESNLGILQIAKLQINIHPPFYKTSWFKFIIFISFLIVLFLIIRFRYTQLHLKATLGLERKEKERITKWDRYKTDFFTSISHEFKTPLTLIITQAELLLYQRKLSSSLKNDIKKVLFNAESLRELSSEFVLLQKLDQETMKIVVQETDIATLVQTLANSFLPYAEGKEVTLKINIDSTIHKIWVDVKGIKKIVNNLLSNAFKYTSKGGIIEVLLKEMDNEVKLFVIDNGAGIPEEEVNLIFQPFYRPLRDTEDASENYNGSGIGLSLVQKMVEIHQGTVQLSSTLKYGSIFTVTLKKGLSHFENNPLVVIKRASETALKASVDDYPQVGTVDCRNDLVEVEEECSPTDKKYSILLVDDDLELLSLLEKVFAPFYTVLTASNGKDGFDLVLKHKPNLVVCDVTMPIATGFDLCYNIKHHDEVNDIPVIILSASEKFHNEAYVNNADVFLSKPFNISQLILVCNNLLNLRNKLKVKYGNDSSSNHMGHLEEVNALSVNSDDLEFIGRVDELLAQNMTQEDFDIDTLADQMYMSRSAFYDKFKFLKGTSPNKYLMAIRLKRSAQLLIDEPNLPISEIAYMVGYGSAKYFSKSFKAFYKKSPSTYRQEKEQAAGV